ncbi:hypothetical protein J2W34_002948 [Variovorax boronicumulans]|uniref:hypothetical protein n=1 Tax=Variovorax TaxID=34072 RepID=UPI0027800AA6|nr:MULTISPECIES: hypothetical protein [Variovorax]MDQ0042858.1 hypothetical protein [Variovorax boronicumulans]MDQ0071154.1 hypothetical protein [Variovorax boronicumulans]MDQ0611813.1 hypothetical protein [Variovorax sp. W1I1]
MSPLDALRPVGAFESSHIDMGTAALYRPWLPPGAKNGTHREMRVARWREAAHFTARASTRATEKRMNIPRSATIVRLTLAATLTAAALSGCYVVPIAQPAPAAPPSQAYAVAPGPIAQSFSARLYPSNAEAARYGTVAGTVTNDMNGRGHFNAQIGGEQFQGEATRVAGSRGAGVANASGNRGGNLSCQYTMNSATLGSGQCVLNSGPAFTMHIGG